MNFFNRVKFLFSGKSEPVEAPKRRGGPKVRVDRAKIRQLRAAGVTIKETALRCECSTAYVARVAGPQGKRSAKARKAKLLTGDRRRYVTDVISMRMAGASWAEVAKSTGVTGNNPAENARATFAYYCKTRGIDGSMAFRDHTA